MEFRYYPSSAARLVLPGLFMGGAAYFCTTRGDPVYRVYGWLAVGMAAATAL